MLNMDEMYSRDFIESKMLTSYDKVNELCLKSIYSCDKGINNVSPEKAERLKAAKGDLVSLNETLEATEKSLKKMCVEYLFAMHNIFMIIKDNKDKSLSDTTSYDDGIYKMYKYIKKNTPSSYKALLHDASHIIDSFKIWYDYAISIINHCTNRLHFIINQFQIDGFLEQEVIRLESELIKIFS